jgi:hypothetical protein
MWKDRREAVFLFAWDGRRAIVHRADQFLAGAATAAALPLNLAQPPKRRIKAQDQEMSKRLFLSLFALLAAGPVSGQPSALPDLRDQRYCEILLGAHGSYFPRELIVYNTIGLNDCPPSLWSRVSVSRVKAETRAHVVRLNGPRHWTIDAFVGSELLNPAVRSFEGLTMREAGVLHLGFRDFLSQRPYAEHTIARRTTELFKAGRPVFQLLDPDGEVFFMQSFSLQVDPRQTIESLPALAQRLRLPKGWSFRVLTLKADYRLEAAGGQATVVQDELLNTYQKSAAKAGDEF